MTPSDKPVIQWDPYSNPNAGKLPHEQRQTEVDMTRVSLELAGQCLAVADKVVRVMRERNPVAVADLGSIAMDLAVVHTHGRPLNLGHMLFTSDRDLLEDVVSIARHLDRYTGKLPAWVRLNNQATVN
jgi:hypothetical protein